jgi:hypothetical protein
MTANQNHNARLQFVKFKVIGSNEKGFFLSFFFVALGLELRTFTFSHCTNPIFVKGFSR